MKTKPKFKLGQIIEIDKYFERRTAYSTVPHEPEGKLWVEIKLKVPKSVMIIGQRTLSNGSREWTRNEGIFYTPEKYIKALLVVEDINHKPFYIPMP